MVRHALDRGYDVVGVCREKSVRKLAEFEGRMEIVPGATDDREVIKRAVAGCVGVLVVLVPRGVHGYASGTAQAVLDHAEPGARLVFSCGWHITLDGQDVYSWRLKALVNIAGPLARLARFADLDDQVEACRRIFASDSRWTVVRGSDLEEGDSQGLPVWSRHVGDPLLESNITRRVDFALFMVEALENDDLVHEAPAIVGCQTPSALAHAAAESPSCSHSRRGSREERGSHGRGVVRRVLQPHGSSSGGDDVTAEVVRCRFARNARNSRPVLGSSTALARRDALKSAWTTPFPLKVASPKTGR